MKSKHPLSERGIKESARRLDGSKCPCPNRLNWACDIPIIFKKALSPNGCDRDIRVCPFTSMSAIELIGLLH